MLDKIAGYLFEKETITGAQMMAILDGRDPDKEDFYGVPARNDGAIEPPAKQHKQCCHRSVHFTTPKFFLIELIISQDHPRINFFRENK